ncbi:glycosyltransferase family 2 protein [Allosphingosinicella sp.]|jgi:glycosyltransferase involved in cell wall biosynthesis|uniref:glycosyltransferase family 2 protein n=1 Tax=Allosphingosinicella sp. TaxID=2823234 RepID=UPI002F17CDE4
MERQEAAFDLRSAEADQAESAPVFPNQPCRIAVVIPCFRGGDTVEKVIRGIGPAVGRIYLVDDLCPDDSGARIAERVADPRLKVFRNEANLGVGGAMKRGYAEALREGAQVIVKLDADGQMDPAFISFLAEPLLAGQADYAKGNRFAPRHRMPSGDGSARPMPSIRRVGNNLLSFVHKAVTGQWHVIDPANGYTAIHRRALESIDLAAVADCYFFETDMLFQLNLVDAVVQDVPLPAHYAGEVSSLKLRRVFSRFSGLALHRFVKRIWVRYFVDDFNVASLELILALPLLLLGSAFGFLRWREAVETGVASSAGTVMFAALPIIIGFQLLLSAISYDVSRRPAAPISRQAAEA